jgi:hypothetical protein
MTATADQLRSHCDGFLTEIRRTFINDLYLTVSRHGVLAKNVITRIEPPQPEFHKEPHEGEVAALASFLTKEDKQFLDFFRRLRNSTVHYDGSHNRRNSLDFTFNGSHFHTTEANLGHQIGYWFSDLFAIHTRLKEIFAVEKVLANEHLRRLLGTE